MQKIRSLRRPPLPVALRVIVKALLVVTVLNVLLLAAGADPVRALVKLNASDLLSRPLSRLAYPADAPRGGGLPVEALLTAHGISKPAGPGEYRVVLLGDAGIAGWGVPDDETLAAELNDLDIRMLGRRVVAYNLAYPQPSAAGDLLILDAALKYEPDLIMWFVTPETLNNSPGAEAQLHRFLSANAGRLRSLASQHDDLIGGWLQAHTGPGAVDDPAAARYFAIHDLGRLPAWLQRQRYIFQSAQQPDRRDRATPVGGQAHYTMSHPGYSSLPAEVWHFLRAGCMQAQTGGAQLVVVNQPVAAGERSAGEIHYNLMYGPELYDRYREALVWFTDYYGIRYVDLWDAVPPGRFTTTPTQMDPLGYKMLAARLQDVLSAGGGSICR